MHLYALVINCAFPKILHHINQIDSSLIVLVSFNCRKLESCLAVPLHGFDRLVGALLRRLGASRASNSPEAEERFLLERGASRRRGSYAHGARTIACTRSYLYSICNQYRVRSLLR